jgi:hypothetical protein
VMGNKFTTLSPRLQEQVVLRQVLHGERQVAGVEGDNLVDERVWHRHVATDALVNFAGVLHRKLEGRERRKTVLFYVAEGGDEIS